MPAILSLYPSFTAEANQGLTNGTYTSLFDLGCVPASGDVGSLSPTLFLGSPLSVPPDWDGSDLWSVRPEWLSDPLDDGSSVLTFPTATIATDVLAIGPGGPLVITLPMNGGGTSTELQLTIYGARLEATLGADRASATDGMVGGVINTEELVGEVMRVGAVLGLCGSPILDSLVTLVRQASDILADGSQDPTRTCDGISIGLGLELLSAGISGVGPVVDRTTCP